MPQAPSKAGPKCAICGKPVEQAFRPFCSVRCKQVDLNRWLTESYRVPVQSADEEEDETARPDRPEES
jgi:endogenous inhibitor of DNA gyrase (YacG/DUF329 family)